MNRNRVQAGVPTGGEFATGAKGENPDLSAEPSGALPWAPDRRLGEAINPREVEAAWEQNRPQPWHLKRMSLAYTAPGTTAYIEVGIAPSNTWFGSSRTYDHIVRPVVLTEDDTIFSEPAKTGYNSVRADRRLVTADGKRYSVSFAPNKTHPFEKGPASPDPAPETGIIVTGASVNDSDGSDKGYRLPEDTHRGWRSFGAMGFIEPPGFVAPEGSQRK